MSSRNKEILMSGNEAIARGANEAGVGFCASYPGTPSTEITETLMRETAGAGDRYCEWSTNEKVALEAAAAASWAGVPALCPMKSLGLNVASDFLLNLNLTGTGQGGLVLVVCDDPMGHSSSNEQDSRFYAKAAKIPLLEPSTYQDAKDIVPFAFRVSRQFEIPVMVRSTTRLSHSRGLVRQGEISKGKTKAGSIPKGLYNVPHPSVKHRDLLKKMERVSEVFDESDWNRFGGDEAAKALVISSGVSTRYVEEALASLKYRSAAVLGLVTTYPLPKKTLSAALTKYKKVVFVEENEPFIEDEVRALGSTISRSAGMYGIRTGESRAGGEMSTDRARSILAHENILRPHRIIDVRPAPKPFLLSERNLSFCAGCTHRNFYYAVKLLKKRLKGALIVSGDIGCYSLGVFYNEAMDTMQAMGSGLGVASGLGQLHRFGFKQQILAVAGDSTFFHACIPALVNCRHKNADVTFVILDNGTTAMTGFQVHPGSKTQHESNTPVDIAEMVKAIGPDHFERGDAENLEGLADLLSSVLKKKGLKVLILDSVCRLEEQRKPAAETRSEVRVVPDLCKGESCQICVREFGCPAITWNYANGRPEILVSQCVMCGACISVCPHGAIRGEAK
jgi:indolepyruvate ferredoxin oxidoreductase alpha subunit